MLSGQAATRGEQTLLKLMQVIQDCGLYGIKTIVLHWEMRDPKKG